MKWPLSLVGLGITILLVIMGSAAFLVILGKWNRATAFFASVPGALSYVIALSLRYQSRHAAGGDGADAASGRDARDSADAPHLVDAAPLLPPPQISPMLGFDA